MPAADKAVEAIRKAATSEQGKKAAKAAGGALAGWLGKEGRERLKARNSGRTDRDLALDLARQIGGEYSEGTVVARRRRYVVWKDGVPVDAFPEPEKGVVLTECLELQDFKGVLLTPPPPKAST